MAPFTDVGVLFLRVSENVIEMELSLYFSPSQGRLGECLVLMTARQGRQMWAQVCAAPPCANGLTAFFFSCREKGVDGSDARRPSRRHGSGLLSAQTARADVQLQHLGSAAPGHRFWIGAVPAGSGVQLQEVPPLQHQRYHIPLKSPRKARWDTCMKLVYLSGN